MPRIPDDIMGGGPRSSLRVVPVEPQSSGLREFGDSLRRVGQHLMDREDRFNYARAQSEFLKRQDEIMRSITDREYQTYESRYSEAIKGALAETQQTIVSRSDRQAFEIQMSEIAQRGRQRILDRAKGMEIDVGRGELLSKLQENKDLAIQSQDEPTRVGVLQSSVALVQGAMEKQLIDHEQAARLLPQVKDDHAEASLLTLTPIPRISALLNQEGTTSFLSEEKRQAMLKSAVAELEADEREARARESYAYTLEQRALQRMYDETAKTGDELLSSGNLSVDWIKANRDSLSDEDYRYFLKTLSGGSSTTDVYVYSDLRQRAADGEDVSGEARQELQSGRLKLSDYDKLVRRSEENRGVSSLPNWFQRGEQYIKTALRVSDVNPDPASAQRQAEAIDDWQEWTIANPDATPEDARKRYQQIVNERQLLEWEDMVIVMKTPRYAVGGRMNMDLEQTIAQTVAARESGELTEDEFLEQSELIEKWVSARERMQQESTP